MNFDYTKLSSKFSLPPKWKVMKVKDLAKVNELIIKKNYPHKVIEYIEIDDVENGRILRKNEISLDKAPTRARRIVRNNDILISSVRPKLKHFTFIKNAKPNTVASTGFVVITAYGIDPRYLYYYLTSRPFTEYLNQIAETHTSAYPSFTPDVIENAELLVPPTPEDEWIGNILGSLDDKIELNYEMNKTLEAIAQAIFKNWFVDFEPFKDQLVYSEELDKEIPEGWEVVTIGDVVDLKKGLSYSSSDLTDKSDVGLVNLGCILPGGGFRNEIKPYSGEFEKDHILQTGDIVVAITDLTRNREVIGMPARIYPVKDFRLLIASLDLVILNPKDEDNLERSFLYYLLLTRDYWGYVNGCADGTTVLHLKPEDILNYKFVLPQEEWQNKFAKIADSIFELKIQKFKENEILSSIRDTLLPKLLSGEIRVKVDIEKEFPEETKKLEEIEEEKAKVQKSIL
ncbi:MAG: restriction endonuclease subunit S, partial [Ignavibacteria bacterium]|nr:restriction endonuclease subunit S [Ignavibacteria bacterium]